MTIIATTFLNLPFANQILNAFDDYSNDYEFTAIGIFRRVNVASADPAASSGMFPPTHKNALRNLKHP